MRTTRRFALTATVAGLALMLTGCFLPMRPGSDTPNTPGNPGNPQPESTAPAVPAAPTGPEIGTPFEVTQNDGTASITVVSATYGPTLDGPFEIEAENGGFLILDILWETSEGVSSPNPFYFKVKDPDGREGDFAIFVDDALPSGDVPVGDRSRGNVAFDIGPGPYIVIVTDQILQEAARLTVTATPR
jgi:hypothetical protein